MNIYKRLDYNKKLSVDRVAEQYFFQKLTEIINKGVSKNEPLVSYRILYLKYPPYDFNWLPLNADKNEK